MNLIFFMFLPFPLNGVLLLYHNKAMESIAYWEKQRVRERYFALVFPNSALVWRLAFDKSKRTGSKS